MPFLFDTLAGGPADTALTHPQRALSERMIGHWSRFVRTVDPNDGAAPAWPVFDADACTALRLSSGLPGCGPIDFAEPQGLRFSDKLRPRP
jgi:carboxylesterase type B